MESQLPRRSYGEDHLHPDEQHKDEAQTMNDSPVVRSGLAEPTVMGTPVLAEDLYGTHSDILDTPVRSFAQWKEEERRGAPPPLPTAYETHLTDLPHGGHHTYGGEGNREQLKGSVGKHTFLEEEEEERPPAFYESANRERLKGGGGNPSGLEVEGKFDSSPPPSTGSYGAPLTHVGHNRDGTGKTSGVKEDMSVFNSPEMVSTANRHSTDTVGKDVGITEVLHSFDKMKVFNEHDTKSSESDKHEPKVYTGSHDQFAPEPVENPPLDTIAADPSNPNSSYTQKISSATSAIADKAAAVKDSIVSKLSSGETKPDDANTTYKTNVKQSFPTVFSHKVADTLSNTLGPVYEKVAGAGSLATAAMQGAEHGEVAGNLETKRGGTVKEYLVDTFKPGDDDKMLSEVITSAFHRGKGDQSVQGGSTTTYEVEAMRDVGERRVQDSGN